ncbi:putative MFS_1 like family-like protein 2 [Homarus americanus]|uniref:Putative MFS_1 like family-like protein 2 n=1 Tax=Homarus americanus TaxID=6706 RepID=A0A8J5NG19_HOMAM|nr:putative MFS_1 like family-like protein 2 [Homarus americanus]
MMVVARQLGVPVGTQGVINALIITTALFAKPLISATADRFPALRKSIFLGLLTAMVLAIGPLGFLPPLYDPPVLRGYVEGTKTDVERFITKESDRCYVTEAWDCVVTCIPSHTCPLGSLPVNELRISHIHSQDAPNLHHLQETSYTSGIKNMTIKHNVNDLTRSHLQPGMLDAPGKDEILGAFYSPDNVTREHKFGELSKPPRVTDVPRREDQVRVTNIQQKTPRGRVREGGHVYLIEGLQADADIFNISPTGEGGDYGSQRAWGALSYGVLGVVSGLLVDWWSGTSITKNYSPAFLLMVGFGTIDILLCTTYLKVPKLMDGTQVWTQLRPLLRQPHIFIFLVLAFLIGFYDGLDVGYVFGVMALVLFLYAIRLLGLALVSMLGLVWTTVAIEVINGPCFGLGFTAMIVHAASITPPGTTNTVQSVVSLCYGTLGYAGASFLGGLVYESVGASMLYFYTGVLASFTFFLHLLYLKFFPNPQGTKTTEVELQEVTEKDILPLNKTTNSNKREEEEEKRNDKQDERRVEEERLLTVKSWRGEERGCKEEDDKLFKKSPNGN